MPQAILSLINSKAMILLNTASTRIAMNYEKIGLQPNEDFPKHISPQQVFDISYSIMQSGKLLLRLADKINSVF